jgi:hypothetical protein
VQVAAIEREAYVDASKVGRLDDAGQNPQLTEVVEGVAVEMQVDLGASHGFGVGICRSHGHDGKAQANHKNSAIQTATALSQGLSHSGTPAFMCSPRGVSLGLAL